MKQNTIALFLKLPGLLPQGKWFAVMLFLNLTYNTPVSAQPDSLVDDIYTILVLDPLIITANDQLPDIKSMIRKTVDDTTFYRAFQRLRRIPYRFSSELYFYKPGWIPYTYLRSLRDQYIIDGMRTNEIIDQYIAPHLTDWKGNYEFYTARMYDKVFFTEKPTPVPDTWSDQFKSEGSSDSRMERYVHDLKILLFAPGTPIDIPFMGDKTAIFSDKQMKLYTYSLSPDTNANQNPVYVFTITADSAYSRDETVIKELKTVFDQKTEQILERTYRLTYQTLLYSFDVKMNIEIVSHKGLYVPVLISYKGRWDIPFKKPEWCRFTFRIIDFL